MLLVCWCYLTRTETELLARERPVECKETHDKPVALRLESGSSFGVARFEAPHDYRSISVVTWSIFETMRCDSSRLDSTDVRDVRCMCMLG
jgi:hypothetical protein